MPIARDLDEQRNLEALWVSHQQVRRVRIVLVCDNNDADRWVGETRQIGLDARDGALPNLPLIWWCFIDWNVEAIAPAARSR